MTTKAHFATLGCHGARCRRDRVRIQTAALNWRCDVVQFALVAALCWMFAPVGTAQTPCAQAELTVGSASTTAEVGFSVGADGEWAVIGATRDDRHVVTHGGNASQPGYQSARAGSIKQESRVQNEMLPTPRPQRKALVELST
jgi:hypothetical protein